MRVPVSLRKDLDDKLAELDGEWSTRTNMTSLVARLLRAALAADVQAPPAKPKRKRIVGLIGGRK